MKLIATLVVMVKTATDEGARSRARGKLESIASDSDEMLSREAKAALAGL